MSPEESKMLVYVALADVSRRRGQTAGSDRFLTLAGVAACRAGRLDVAERCRELVLADNPRHLLSRWPSVAAALRAADFAPYLKRLERFCPLERGEHILRELNERAVPAAADAEIVTETEPPEIDAGGMALQRLSGPQWPTTRQ